MRDGKLGEIGTVTGRAKREVSAAGPVVAPGFIDPHTHYDDDVLAGKITLENLDTDRFTVYAHQNEDIVRLTPEQLKQKMAAKEAARHS